MGILVPQLDQLLVPLLESLGPGEGFVECDLCHEGLLPLNSVALDRDRQRTFRQCDLPLCLRDAGLAQECARRLSTTVEVERLPPYSDREQLSDRIAAQRLRRQ